MAFTDDFTGTLNQNLGARTGWTLVDGIATAAQINASNQLKCSTTQSAGSHHCTDQGSANHYTQAEFQRAGNMFGVAARITDGNNFYGMRFSGGRWQIYKRVGGVFTQIGSNYTVALTAGDVGKIEIDSANNVSGYVNGTLRIGAVTDSFNSTETRQGIIARSQNVDPWIDNFEAGTLGGGPITGTGSLAAGPAAISSIGERIITASGSMIAGPAAISGSGTVGAAVTGTGSLVASAATVSGVGERTLTGIGSLVAGVAAIIGAGIREIKGNGSLVSGPAAMSGNGSILGTISGTGSLIAGAASISGVGTVPNNASLRSLKFRSLIYRALGARQLVWR